MRTSESHEHAKNLTLGKYVMFTEHGQAEADILFQSRGDDWKDVMHKILIVCAMDVQMLKREMILLAPAGSYDTAWIEAESLRLATSEEIAVFQILSR